jgi:carbamate kinase
MRVVVALGGNALLKRGEPMTAEVQRADIRTAAQALAPVAKEHQLVISHHGNGPQVGLLALQGSAFKADEAYPLDVLGAETEGMNALRQSEHNSKAGDGLCQGRR